MVCLLVLFSIKKETINAITRSVWSKTDFLFQNEDFFAFSSELKSLMSQAKIPENIDQLSVARFLINDYIPALKTIFKSVYKLEPGSYLTFSDRSFTKTRYWNFFPRTIR